MLKKLLVTVQKNRVGLLLTLIIVSGGALRFLGTNPGYNPFHADETMSYSTAWQMLINHNLDPKRYDYPALIPIINLFFYVFFFLPLYWIKYISLHYNFFPQLNQLVGNGDLQAMFWTRYVTAFFSTVMLVLVYLTSIKLYKSKLIGIFAVTLLAFNYKIVINSHFGLPDIYNALFFYICLYTTLNILENPSFKNYLLAGVGVGLSFSTKFQIYGILPIMLSHLYITYEKPGNILTKFKEMVSIKLVALFVLIPVIVILLNPYHLTNFSKFYEANQYTLLRYYAQRSMVYGISYLFYIGLTPFIFITAFLGTVLSLKENFLRSLLLLSIPATFLYVLFIAIGGAGFTRNYVSVIPFLIIFSAYFFNWFYKLLLEITGNRYISGIIVSLLLTVSLYNGVFNSFILVKSYMQPWGMTSLNNFISQELKSGKPKIAAHQWDFSTVLSKPNAISDNFELVPLKLNSSYLLSELQEENADYALVGLDIINTENSWWMTQQERLGFSFWNMRKQLLSNQLSSLAVNELTQNTIFSAVKPWQAPDNNYVFVKIPPKQVFNSKKISEDHFNDQNLTGWQKIDGSSGSGKNFRYDSQTGFEKTGALEIVRSSPKFLIVRAVSPVFSVSSGKGYQVVAWVKSADKIDKNQRDGFLRLDFYSKKPQVWNETTQSMQINLSARYFGEDWMKLEVVGVPPKDAKFATVSFQVSTPSTTDFWLDDLVIAESVKNINDSKVGSTYQIKDEILYPYSQGGL